MTLKIGVKTIQVDVEWAVLRETWELADETPSIDSMWLFDHLISHRQRGGSHEGLTLAAALGAATKRVQFGHLVLANTHRHPALLAKMASTIDLMSSGRFIVGLGSGWLAEEHTMFGFDLPALGERISRLGESAQILKGMWQNPEGFSFAGEFYHVSDARCDPPPWTLGGPPLWLGTQGLKRGLRLVAEFADGWTTTSEGWEEGGPGNLALITERRDALFRHCEDVGRDPASLEISARVNVGGSGSRPTQRRTVLDECQQLRSIGATHIILSMLASDGVEGLRQLTREIVEPLREL